jgi:aspartyl-tRNA(Asn)/glutamyl-tRNA(Gln) amidotransferase subunit B
MTATRGAGPAGGVLERYEAVIGLEVHAQLLTQSKMFCGCAADYVGCPPNSNTCPVCLGLPGVLPVINRVAVEYTVRTALALDCTIPEHSKFDRKNYFYPDLPKGYQISQYDMPMSRDGHLDLVVDGEAVRCGITRVHLEEDTGTLQHAGDVLQEARSSLVDLNRAGVPLMEIVGEPDLRSPEQAREYLVRLRQILVYIGVNDGNLEQGSFRCDANISLKRRGSDTMGVKVEVKNMNSFRAVQRALEYEIQRQGGMLERGEPIVQETRGWVEARAATVSQRSKEHAHDYRYFPEPDLPPLHLTADFVAGVRAGLPELPAQLADRLRRDHRLSAHDALLVSAERDDARAFEALVAAGVSAKTAVNWLMGEVARLSRESRVPLHQSGLGVAGLAALLGLVEEGRINGPTAKALLEELYRSGGDAARLVAERELGQVNDAAELSRIVDSVIAGNPAAAADFRGGKEQALQRLVGGVMKATQGRADARVVNRLLRDRLAG